MKKPLTPGRPQAAWGANRLNHGAFGLRHTPPLQETLPQQRKLLEPVVHKLQSHHKAALLGSSGTTCLLRPNQQAELKKCHHLATAPSLPPFGLPRAFTRHALAAQPPVIYLAGGGVALPVVGRPTATLKAS